MNDLTKRPKQLKPHGQTGNRLAETLSAAVAISVGMGFGQSRNTGGRRCLAGAVA
ncbi:MAG TPA: hypothetical protein VIF60_25060 [Burkholderiaceae bacterium]